MLTEIYIEALLVDEEMADQVWEAWDKGEIDEATAFLARDGPICPDSDLIIQSMSDRFGSQRRLSAQYC